MATCEAHCLSLAATSSSLSLRANITPSTKPEIRNVSLRRPRRTEPRPQVTCTKNLVKTGRVDMIADKHTRWTESSRSTDPLVIGATCDAQTDQCARRMVCHRRRKSTSSSLLQQQGPSWPSAWRQELLCASPRKPIWHLSSTVSRHTCQGVQSATRKEPNRMLVS